MLSIITLSPIPLFFFFNDTATTEIYTLSLHDALPIYFPITCLPTGSAARVGNDKGKEDRKSTRLNSSHGYISYAVFCLKKKINDRKRKHAVDNPIVYMDTLPT